MQWAVQDNGKSTSHSGLEQALEADIAAMTAQGGAMDVSGLERAGFEAVRSGMDGQSIRGSIPWPTTPLLLLLMMSLIRSLQ